MFAIIDTVGTLYLILRKPSVTFAMLESQTKYLADKQLAASMWCTLLRIRMNGVVATVMD